MDAQGAVESLLRWLTAVLVSEAQLLGGVRGDVQFIKDEMESMNGLLMRLTEAQYYRDDQVGAWMKQVVGLTRDFGGNVELYVHYVGGRPGDGDGVFGYLRRIPRFLRTIAVRHRIAMRIKELKVRARDVGDRRLRYGVTIPPVVPDHQQNCSGSTGNEYDKPGGPEEEEDLQRRELLLGEPPADTVDKCFDMLMRQWLAYSLQLQKEREERDINIIRIAGRGMVGKTSIAKRFYDHPSVVSSFHRRIWINLGGCHKYPGEIAHEIIQHLFPVGPAPNVPGIGVNDGRMGAEWSRYRQEFPEGDRRFLLLVLDAAPSSVFTLHDHCYFLMMCDNLFQHNEEPYMYCQIIVTTRYEGDFWESNCKTHTLDVSKLDFTLPWFFQQRAIALYKFQHAPLLPVLEECYPDAFALQMFLHLLYINPYRSTTEMTNLSKALEEHKNNTSRTMLMLSYNDLPIKYKTCLQYLSIFPQGHIIRRTSLIRRWLAEGLVNERRITSNNKVSSSLVLDDHAEGVFDALVTRGFLRPEKTSDAGKIKNCTMHHKVHDFIATDVSFMDTCLPPDLVYRLSINSGIALEKAPSPSDGPFDVILSLLDSLPGSDQWQLLKVLDLEGCRGLTKKHLKNISKILLLRYLSLRDTDVTQLPKKIDKLQCLETLDIRQTEIRAFATNSILLPMLKHLLAGNKVSNNSTPSTNSPRSESLATVRLPSGTRRMRRLEILSHVDASNNVDDLIDIGQLLQLRKLGVILNGRKAGSLALLFQQIEKLHGCLRALSVRINHPATSEGTVPETERLAALEYPPNLLQSLNISGITSGLPDWITELNQLTKLTLSETYLWEDGIRVFGKLRILRCLRLQRKSYIGTKLTFSAEEFKHLKSLIIEGCDINNIEFVNTGAAPKLEMLIWSFASVETLPLSGIDHLPKLKKIELNGDGDMAAVRKATEAHPNHPIFNHNPSHQRQEAGTD